MKPAGRDTPGRHHRRAVPHFWTTGRQADWLARKERDRRKRGLTPAEIRELELAAAERRCRLLARVAAPPASDDRPGLAALALLLHEAEAA